MKFFLLFLVFVGSFGPPLFAAEDPDAAAILKQVRKSMYEGYEEYGNSLPQEVQPLPEETEGGVPGPLHRPKDLGCQSCRKDAQEDFRKVTERATDQGAASANSSASGLPPFFCRTTTPPQGLIVDKFCAQHVCWASGSTNSCAPSGWKSESRLGRAKWVYESFVKLVAAHKIDISPRILLCKVINESNLYSNTKNSTSGARGMGQVLETTAKDLFARYGFRSRVYGFQNIASWRDYYNKTVNSPLAQLEIGMMVLDMKRKDFGGDIQSNLQNYLGTGSDSVNSRYASQIYSCADCIKNISDRIQSGGANISALKDKYVIGQPGPQSDMNIFNGESRDWGNQVIQEDCLQKARNNR